MLIFIYRNVELMLFHFDCNCNCIGPKERENGHFTSFHMHNATSVGGMDDEKARHLWLSKGKRQRRNYNGKIPTREMNEMNAKFQHTSLAFFIWPVLTSLLWRLNATSADDLTQIVLNYALIFSVIAGISN